MREGYPILQGGTTRIHPGCSGAELLVISGKDFALALTSFVYSAPFP